MIINTYYVGFWERLFAYIIDGILISVPFAIINYLQSGSFDFFENLTLALLWAVIYIVYSIIFPATNYQATPGKFILGMKIVDRDGQRISLGRSALRFLGEIISCNLIFIGYIMIGLTKNKRGLHDFIASTFVVKRDY